MGRKIIRLSFLVSILVIVIVGTVYLFNNQPTEILNLEGTNTSTESDNMMVTNSLQEESVVNDDLFRDLSNPRLRIRNATGYEVIGLDHSGTIAGMALTIDNNATVGNSGFFGWLGSQASKITGGWFEDIDASGDVNFTGNVTLEKIVFDSNSSHYMEDNSTCVFIYGDTSVLEIC